MLKHTQADEKLFEQQVRDIARHLWPEAEYAGARMLDGRQHDGVFETEDCVHFVETTVSRGAKKSHDDIKKMVAQAEKRRAVVQGRTVQCWFVTQDEPTADQREHQLAAERKSGIKVNALSFRQFQARLVDGSRYLDARQDYPFGSVRDPTTGAHNPSVPYIPTAIVSERDPTTCTLKALRGELAKGARIVLLGDYGAGKSMALREVHAQLRKQYLQGKLVQFPVHLNLRDHWGQSDAAEVLERHARKIGFEARAHLVRAWRAGLTTLLIDGFDELSSPSVSGAWRKLRDARHRSMKAVRELMRDSPANTGVLLAGRAQFFDTPDERRRALALTADARVLHVTDFTEEQIVEYMKNSGPAVSLPAWVPPRPLLVSYLAARGALPLNGEPVDASEPAAGWDALLDRICEREAQIEAGLDAESIRFLIERISTYARRTPGGLGPITEEHLVELTHPLNFHAPAAART